MLSSKGNMLSCMILLTFKRAITRTHHRAVDRYTQTRLHALVDYFTCNLTLMLVDITHQAFIKCLVVNLNS